MTQGREAEVPTLDATVADPTYKPVGAPQSPGATKLDTLGPLRAAAPARN